MYQFHLLLNSRIKDLKEAGILERTLDGYQLTNRGNELFNLLLPFGEWSKEWSKEVFGYSNVELEKLK